MTYKFEDYQKQQNYQQAEPDLGTPLNFDDVLNADSTPREFEPFPPGNYPFRVVEITRGQFDGSKKMAPSPKVDVTCEVFDEHSNKSIRVRRSLILNSKTAFVIAQFFESIGKKKKGEPIKMDWNVIGSGGYLELGQRKSTTNGKMYNEIKRFISRG